MEDGTTLRTVHVPQGMEEIYAAAERAVSRYFADRHDDPERGTIEISGERYVLVRAASLSVEFFGLVNELYGAGREAEADQFARNILFDLAHAIGRKDAKSFHDKMGVSEPLQRASAGPSHFAHAGWAHVSILPESSISADDGFLGVFEHKHSFEADAWLRSGKKRDFPVCIMSSGYASGWCQESYGIQLVAAEVRCRARGDEICRFVMAPPTRIEGHVKRELRRGGASIIPDLFARKRAEERLRQAHAELEKRVEERTAELEREMEERRRVERELYQRNKLEALGRLAGGVAHDFNNLMSIVLANGGLLLRGLEADDPRRTYAEEMVNAVRRAADLTAQLLAFGRGSPGEREHVEIDKVAGRLARMLERLIGDDVTLDLRLNAEGGVVLASRSELEQVLVNLVVNARDAMPHGGHIEVTTSMQEPKSDQAALQKRASKIIALKVRDTGIGIPKEALSSIFDPFFTTKPGTGTGLGLSIVYGIAQRAGGDVSVDTKVGEGTTFTVTFPHIEEHRQPSIPPARPPSEPARGETVLLVEDQPLLRRILRQSLEQLGYSVIDTASPFDALTMVERGATPSILLTDLMLPQMSGVDLASRIELVLPNLATVFMSGNPDDALQSRKSSGKPVPFLAKPFTFEVLESTLRDVIAQSRR